jgi:GAF domain-containing protein
MKEENRLKVVTLFQQLDLEQDLELNNTIGLAAKLFNTPVSLLNLLGADTQWSKVKIGLDVVETPAKLSFCTHTIKSNRILVVNDTFEDARFSNHPQVVTVPGFRFYAGVPLTTNKGYRIGTLCVLDYKPRSFEKEKQLILKVMAKHVISILESKLSLDQLRKSINNQNEILSKIANIHSHEYRRPIASIMGLINLIEEDNFVASKEYLLMLKTAATELDQKTQTIMSLINDLKHHN